MSIAGRDRHLVRIDIDIDAGENRVAEVDAIANAEIGDRTGLGSRPRGNTLVFGDEFSRLSSQSGNVLYGMVMRAYAENQGRWGSYLQEQLIITHWDSSAEDAHESGDPPRIVNQAAPTTAGTLQIDLDAVLSPLREAGTIRVSRALARR